MLGISLTPASISCLTHFLLSLAIFVFLALHLRSRTTQSVWLTGLFGATTLFVGLLCLDATLAPYPRLFAVYAENAVFALAFLFLLQFAYRFPQRKWEALAGLIAGPAYLLLETLYMVYRYTSLLARGMVLYRPFAFDIDPSWNVDLMRCKVGGNAPKIRWNRQADGKG